MSVAPVIGDPGWEDHFADATFEALTETEYAARLALHRILLRDRAAPTANHALDGSETPKRNPEAEAIELEVAADLPAPEPLGSIKEPQTEEEAVKGALAGVRIVPLDVFVDTEEQGSEAVLGDADNAVIPEGGDVMVYGDGGAGKTTLCVDAACHFAAGDPWLGIRVPRPLRVLIIENEGPRPRFRQKLKRKRDAWAGSPIGDRISVLEAPWGAFTFADERWRELLVDRVLEHEVDVVICGPVTCAGMNAAGTLQEVRDFLVLVGDVRRRSGRRLVVILVHHENKGGKVSGAWEGAGDTLLHVSAQGHGRLRLHFQKARWASDYHATTLQLLWAAGDSFEVEEKDELDDETIGELIVARIDEHPGTTWGAVEKATPGMSRDRRNGVRDGLFAAGRIVNVARDEGGVDVALAYCPERRTAQLHLADDPLISHLLPASGADGEQIAPPGGERGEKHLLRAPRPLKGSTEEQMQAIPPAPDLLTEAAAEEAAS